jgi:hypothetical protein
MVHHDPRHRPDWRSSYTSDLTPIADFLIGAWQVIIVTGLGLLISFVAAFALASAFVDGIGAWTGATAAWAALVAEASSQPHDLIGIGVIMAQNLVCGAVMSFLLAAPSLRRCLRHDNIKWLAKEIGSPSGIAALQVGITCLVIHLLISLAVAAVLAAAGVIIPAPDAIGTIVSPHTFAATYLSSGGGGGWPPGAEVLSNFAIVLIVLLLVVSAVVGAAIYSIAYGAAIIGAQGVSGGAARGASALGASIVAVLCTGEPYKRWNFGASQMIFAGIVKGVAAGALYAVILLAGAAFLGVG